MVINEDNYKELAAQCKGKTGIEMEALMASNRGPSWKSTSSPFSGTYNVAVNFTGGYTYEGEDFLKKHTNGALTMVSMEPIQCFLVTNPWEDDDYNSQTLEMK